MNITLTNGACNCPAAYFLDVSSGADNPVCTKCKAACTACTTSTACLSCTTGTSTPASGCPCTTTTQYFSETASACTACNPECLTCAEAVYCLTCKATATLLRGECKCTALTQYYDRTTDTCTNCTADCNWCVYYSGVCLSCDKGKELTSASACVCPDNYFPSMTGTGTCTICGITDCVTCTSATVCSKCINNLVFVANSCGCGAGLVLQSTA